jgi:hypothetical protein
MVEHTRYLCIGPQCWGTGAGPGGVGRAVANAKKNCPNWNGSKKNMEYDLWLVPPSCYVTELGGISWEKVEGEPVLVKQVRYDKAGKRSVREINMTVSEWRKHITPVEIVQ